MHLPRSLTMIGLLTAFAAAAPAPANATDAFTIDWHAIDGGGVSRARNSCFVLSATIAQSISGYSLSTNYSIAAGFWPLAPTTHLDDLFFDGLEDCSP